MIITKRAMLSHNSLLISYSSFFLNVSFDSKIPVIGTIKKTNQANWKPSKNLPININAASATNGVKATMFLKPLPLIIPTTGINNRIIQVQLLSPSTKMNTSAYAANINRMIAAISGASVIKLLPFASNLISPDNNANATGIKYTRYAISAYSVKKNNER